MKVIKTSAKKSAGAKTAPSKSVNKLHRRHERLHVNKGITH